MSNQKKDKSINLSKYLYYTIILFVVLFILLKFAPELDVKNNYQETILSQVDLISNLDEYRLQQQELEDDTALFLPTKWNYKVNYVNDENKNEDLPLVDIAYNQVQENLNEALIESVPDNFDRITLGKSMIKNVFSSFGREDIETKNNISSTLNLYVKDLKTGKLIAKTNIDSDIFDRMQIQVYVVDSASKLILLESYDNEFNNEEIVNALKKLNLANGQYKVIVQP